MDNDTTVHYLGGRLSDLFCLVRDEVVQIIGNSLGFGCSGDNGAFISLQDGQPIINVGGCVFVRIMGNTEVSAEKCCRQFCDELFDRVSVGTEAA